MSIKINIINKKYEEELKILHKLNNTNVL